MILSPKLTIEHTNPAFARMLKKEKKEFDNQEHGKLIRWANPPSGLPLEEAVAGGWPLTHHAHLYVEGDLLIGPNEPRIPVGITYAPLVSSEGTIVNIKHLRMLKTKV